MDTRANTLACANMHELYRAGMRRCAYKFVHFFRHLSKTNSWLHSGMAKGLTFAIWWGGAPPHPSWVAQARVLRVYSRRLLLLAAMPHCPLAPHSFAACCPMQQALRPAASQLLLVVLSLGQRYWPAVQDEQLQFTHNAYDWHISQSKPIDEVH